MLERIDHVGVAVESIDSALGVFRDTLGMPVVHRETVQSQGVEAVLLDIGEGHIELLQPLDADTPVGRFLAKRGPGMHHVAYAVADIEVTLSELKDRGVELIDDEPRAGIRRSRVAFVHPRAMGGVLTEIVEPAPGH